jgi:hypothetical protein
MKVKARYNAQWDTVNFIFNTDTKADIEIDFAEGIIIGITDEYSLIFLEISNFSEMMGVTKEYLNTLGQFRMDKNDLTAIVNELEHIIYVYKQWDEIYQNDKFLTIISENILK